MDTQADRSTLPVPPPLPGPLRAPSSTGRAIGLTLLAIAAAGAALLLMYAANPRLFASWHGFLHGAIAIRFPVSGVPPENPFFAGEPLPYYWFYHFVGYLVLRLFDTDPLHAFQSITFASLAALIAAGAAIGHRRFGSLPAGFAVAVFAIVGGNPLGLVIAAAKGLTGQPVLGGTPPATDHILVDNLLADRLMTSPLLPALHFGTDWRFGQNLPWFFDISSRTPALALVIVFLFLWLGRPRHANLIGLACVAALLTAVNPLIGLGLVGAMAGAQTLLAIPTLRRDGGRAAVLSLGRPTAALGGVLIALPTFYHMLLLEGTSEPSSLRIVALKAVLAATIFILLLPAAIIGVRRAPPHVREQLRTIALAGGLLVAGLILVRLEEGNEHNISNLAQCVLAVPAAAAIAFSFPGRVPSGWRRLGFIALLCAPTAAATILSFSGRPGIPLAAADGQLRRLPAYSALQRGYDWIRATTPEDAVVVIDPRRAIKMSGNVSELPAFTGRAVFVDQPIYLVTPHVDAERRAALAAALVEGRALTGNDAAYLDALDRPLFLASYGADPALRRRLSALWGTPRFSAAPLDIYELTPAMLRQSPRSAMPVTAETATD